MLYNGRIEEEEEYEVRDECIEETQKRELDLRFRFDNFFELS